MAEKEKYVLNDCICCAERKMIYRLRREASKKGVKGHQIATWIHRVHGNFVIERIRRDGITGISLPCVLCKKAMERSGIQWIAYQGTHWVNSNQSDYIPKSKPTCKQIKTLGFSSYTQRDL